MNLIESLILMGVVLTAFISLLIYLLIINQNKQKFNVQEAFLSGDKLGDHALKTALEHSVSNKASAWPIPRMNDNFDFILSVYVTLNEEIQKKHTIPEAAEWLLDNFYIIEEQVKGLRRDMRKQDIQALPVLNKGSLKGNSRIFALAIELVGHTNGQIDEKNLAEYLKAYQRHHILLDREIWALPAVIRLALIENIRHLSEDIERTQHQWQRADEVFNQWLSDVDQVRFMKHFKDQLIQMDDVDSSFVEHLFYRLRRSSHSYVSVLNIMDENLIQLGTSTQEITQKEHNAQSLNTVLMGNCITSLRYFTSMDWTDLFEAVSHVDQILRQDPDGTYPLMDLQTRNHYRSEIEKMALRHGVSELFIAREATKLASLAHETKKNHVGYYLIGKGVQDLHLVQAKKKKLRYEIKAFLTQRAGIFYLGLMLVLTFGLILLASLYAFDQANSNKLLIGIIAGFAVLIPASEISLNIVNRIVTKTVQPYVFPKLELRKGIPTEFSTIVAIPTLLSDKKRVHQLLNHLERHYLSNREENLYFCLIGAYGDWDEEYKVSDPGIIKTTLEGIRELNQRYVKDGKDIFYFFHRDRQFSTENDKWIGWERKRGALMEFNAMVLGASQFSFGESSCANPPFENVRYVITLDSDSILPMGMAKKMIGTMAHPLNQPVIDPIKKIVTEGYGLLQPRIETENENENFSIFSRIFGGIEGIDPYTNAVSDVYQDLFGEGSFTGKGIYDLQVFETVLKDAIPENAVLSHDLLEGSYVRSGLATDIKLVDTNPSRYNAYSARLFRWVRGDWQLLPFLHHTVRNSKGERITNPLSLLSKMKMWDNLRRSLVAPSILLYIFLMVSFLPGNVYIWLAFLLIVQAFPLFVLLITELLPSQFAKIRLRSYLPVIEGLEAETLKVLVGIVFVPHQAMLMLRAISITLVRVFVTGKNLLEWVTSADMERSQKNSLASYLKKMRVSFGFGLVLPIVSYFIKPETFSFSILIMILWFSAPLVAYFISIEREPKPQPISKEDKQLLRLAARKTWRYFEEFSNSSTHHLIPDNYQVDPPTGLAYRTSPTNIGLNLMSILSAQDLGYFGLSHSVTLIDQTLAVMEDLDKWNGHLYNWYDTTTLKPLHPVYVSTVDSGNLAGYLITVRQALKTSLDEPLIKRNFIHGLEDTLLCGGKACSMASLKLKESTLYTAQVFDLFEWNHLLNTLDQEVDATQMRKMVWLNKVDEMIKRFKMDMAIYRPEIAYLESFPQLGMPLGEPSAQIFLKLTSVLSENGSIDQILTYHQDAKIILEQLKQTVSLEDFKTWVDELERLLNQVDIKLREQKSFIDTLILRLSNMIDAMKFIELFDKKKQLFSIGFNILDNKLTNSYYDLLTSEARQTSYISIARGEVTPVHWFRLGRVLTIVDRYKGLISWTGTMFEYLMPLLIMKTYKHTLLDETYSFVIKSQKKYAAQRDTPWGTSESGFNALSHHHEYQYKAIGIPWLGLKRGLIEDVVVAPYATFLALMVDPKAAISNLKRLSQEGMDGPYGYYEAADYTPERRPFETKRAIVKSFMAHHQGMSLVAIDNFLNDNIMQKRFHADPEMNAARMLLQEKVPTNLVITKSYKEKVMPYKEPRVKERNTERVFEAPNEGLSKVHMLTNGNTRVMITDRGTGYSKDKMMAISRWREDSSLDAYGMFFYIKNTETNQLWSSTYAPLNVLPNAYKVSFTSDKACFERSDGLIDTKTEVIVATGDNVEIRRITLKNNSDQAVTLELTSYFEVVLAAQNTDVAHPAFSNLFIETDYLADKHCLRALRRPRSAQEDEKWLANALVIKDKPIGNIQVETDRNQWMGRGHDLKSASTLCDAKPLSNTTGPVLDPCMSHQVRFKLEAGKSREISFVNAISENEEVLMSLIDKYNTVDAIEAAFQLAKIRSQMETRYLNLEANEIELYQDMLSDLLFNGLTREKHQAILLQNTKSQSDLWKYGISGDHATVLLTLHSTTSTQILNEILKAHAYWRLMDLRVDLIIVSDESYSYANPLFQIISDIVQSSQSTQNGKQMHDIFILDKNKIESTDIPLFYASSRIILEGDGRSLKEQVSFIDRKPRVQTKPINMNEKSDLQTLKRPELQLFNGLGGFSSEGDAYVMHLTKGLHTPAPWINVIANPKFGFVVSEAGSSTTFAENSHESKLTPWSNDAISDPSGDVLYLHDEVHHATWTTTALPIREDDDYLITHGFGYSIFEHHSHAIKQTSTVFVVLDESIKLNILSLENTSDQRRFLTLTHVIKPVLAANDQSKHLTLKTRVNDAGVLFIENPQGSFRNKRVIMDVSSPERTWTSDRNAFYGTGGRIDPDGLYEPQLSGKLGTGFDLCGAIQVKVILEPKAKQEVIFMLGVAQSDDEIKRLSEYVHQEGKAQASLMEVKAFWKSKLNRVKVQTPSPSMNLLLNGWLQYQTIACRLWARSGFYQSGGATGFRDQLQDSLAVAHLIPELSRKQILIQAAHQFREGDVQHWWHDPEGSGVRTRISDDLLWLPYVSTEYMRITGDQSIWNEQASFLNAPVLGELEDDRYSQPEITNETASLYEHCALAIEHALRFGEHGLPLMGSGDWNDGMNRVGHKGKGESVWLAWFLVTVLAQFIPICKQQNDPTRAFKYEQIRAKLIQSIEAEAWDGKWYRRAYFDNGQVLGSSENTECKIDSIAQSWAIISHAGDPERAKQALQSLEDYLVDRENGLIRLLTPAFNSDEFEPGYIKGYLPGIRENGGQYTHAAAWAIIAYTKMGEGNKALEAYDMINPINHSNNYREYMRYKVEPYVMAADVYSVYPHQGKGGWTWYTGSSGWMLRAGLEYILGFKKTGETLIIDPVIPTYWDDYSMKYVYMSATYHIKVENPDHLNKGVRRLTIDDRIILSNQIDLVDDGLTHEVLVLLGA